MASAHFRRLTYSYPGATGPALRGVELGLPDGLVLLAGGSGSGKSTLLRCLNGLVPQFHGGTIRGEVMVGDFAIASAPTRRLAEEVGFVFQDPEAQQVYASVEREVAFGLENLAIPRGQIRARVEEALAACGGSHLFGRRIDRLSGGERQRVAIASALAMRPGLLAMDEPLSQLDDEGAELVLGVMRATRDRGLDVVVAEHRLDLLLPEADAVVIMDAGRVASPVSPRAAATSLPAPPQVVRLGRALGWNP
ncbi:MAG: ABC transporter ATP-binding protein, partial [Candidatus Dormibacteria bacterium]